MSEKAYNVIVPSLPHDEAVKLAAKIRDDLGYASTVVREVGSYELEILRNHGVEPWK